jgi:hypothetical protein
MIHPFTWAVNTDGQENQNIFMQYDAAETLLSIPWTIKSGKGKYYVG